MAVMVEEQRRMAQALENCRLLAARHRKEEWAQHILRFCEEGGATANTLREWQGLTDEEIDDEYFDNWSISRMREFARAIEAKLKENNT